MDLFLSNVTVLELVRVEMMRRATLCTDDSKALADLAEAIEAIHQDFLMENESTLLQRDRILEYSQSNFEAIVQFLPSHILNYWADTSSLRKLFTFVQYLLAARRIRKLVRVAEVASCNPIISDC